MEGGSYLLVEICFTVFTVCRSEDVVSRASANNVLCADILRAIL